MNTGALPKNKKIPCHKCEDRFVDIANAITCHETCERYAEFVAYNAKKRETEREQARFEKDYHKYRHRVLRKIKENTRKGM